MTFHNIRLNQDVEYGAVGGPKFNTTVWTATSGYEKRNVNWSQVRAEYSVGYGVKTQEEIDAIREHFYARQGRAHSFPFKDWTDYKLVRQSIGTTDGSDASWQVYKRYTSGGINYDRTITKVIADADIVSYTFAAWINNVSVTVVEGSSPGAAQVGIDRTTGILTLGSTHAATTGYSIEVQCEFYVPVRYDIDHLPVSIDEFNVFSVGSIPLVEVRDIA